MPSVPYGMNTSRCANGDRIGSTVAVREPPQPFGPSLDVCAAAVQPLVEIRSVVNSKNSDVAAELSKSAPMLGVVQAAKPTVRFRPVQFHAVQFHDVMRSRRYTVLIADRSSGVVRRVTVSVLPALALVFGILMLPILMGLGAKWSAKAEIGEVRAANLILQVVIIRSKEKKLR